jgi:class 3 adenylate cyclase
MRRMSAVRKLATRSERESIVERRRAEEKKVVTHPERTMALVLLNGSAGVDDRRVVRWTAKCERLSCTPEEAVWPMRAWLDADFRGVLPAVNVPTLVLSRGEHLKYREMARYVAGHIVGARFVLLPESDFFFFAGDTTGMLDTIEEFLTGRLAGPVTDRVLATVLFTDVVGSTEQVARLGDRRWRELLSNHDKVIRAELERLRGREIKSTGDGFLATFDGPGRAIQCACSIRDVVHGLGLEIRAGLHTGEIELRGDDIAGIAVHIGQRVSVLARPGEVLVSSSVPPLVTGSGIDFDDGGEHDLKGLPEPWRLFAVRCD